MIKAITFNIFEQHVAAILAPHLRTFHVPSVTTYALERIEMKATSRSLTLGYEELASLQRGKRDTVKAF